MAAPPCITAAGISTGTTARPAMLTTTDYLFVIVNNCTPLLVHCMSHWQAAVLGEVAGIFNNLQDTGQAVPLCCWTVHITRCLHQCLHDH
jgi:hypothetical protein